MYKLQSISCESSQHLHVDDFTIGAQAESLSTESMKPGINPAGSTSGRIFGSDENLRNPVFLPKHIKWQQL